jgi:hypothetical protein
MIPIKVDLKMILNFLEFDDHVKFPNGSHNVPSSSFKFPMGFQNVPQHVHKNKLLGI